MDLIRVETPHPGVSVISLHDPALQNQGSWKAIGELSQALESARTAGSRVAVLASDLPEVWFSHAYLQDLVSTFRGKPSSGDPLCWMKAMAQVAHPDLICIAAVHGMAVGGGAELCWACDLRVAEEDATFCQLEAAIGLPPGLGGISRLARLAGRSLAAEAVLDAGPIDARRLYATGAINRLTPKGKAREVAVGWAARIASHGSEVLSALKQQLQRADELPLGEALQKEQLALQKFAFNRDVQERLIAIQARYDAGESLSQVHGWTHC